MSNILIEGQINEKFVCVLKLKSEINRVELEYLPLKRFFVKELSVIERMCSDKSVDLIELASYINETDVLCALDKRFQYCEDFKSAYQDSVQGKSGEMPMSIFYKNNLLLQQYSMSPNGNELAEEIQSVKTAVLENYKLWINAYCLQETNRHLDKDDSILVYSHRRMGWSKRPHVLTPAFSVQIDTNFGYGRSSYFFSKLTYKKIDLIPFSEWVEYRYANFFEIIRYTVRHDLRNECWHQAMEFCRDACNLSLSDETMFVEKYIVSECEKMVNGLEIFLTRDVVTLKDLQIKNEQRVLIEFRGEKISGALNFIEKILGFSEIFAVGSLIYRIEACNKSIQPILEKELGIINAELEEMTREMYILKPVYLPLEERNQAYNRSKDILKKKLMVQDKVKQEDLNYEKLEAIFEKENIAYKEFVVTFAPVSRNYNTLLQKMNATAKTKNAVTAYNDKILSYFLRGKILQTV